MRGGGRLSVIWTNVLRFFKEKSPLLENINLYTLCATTGPTEMIQYPHQLVYNVMTFMIELHGNLMISNLSGLLLYKNLG